MILSTSRVIQVICLNHASCFFHSLFFMSRGRTELYSIKVSLKVLFLPPSLACRRCSEACNRNTMSEAGENSQAKLSVSSPVPGCEI